MAEALYRKRRVYVATGLTVAEIGSEFAELLREFERVERKAEAEFVVMDLTTPPVDYACHLKLPEPEHLLPLPKEIPAPLFLVRRGPQQSVNPTVNAVAASLWGNRLRLCESVSCLVQEMLWFERVAPLTRHPERSESSEALQAFLALALHAVKEGSLKGGGA